MIRFNELKAAEQLLRHRPMDSSADDPNTVLYKCPDKDKCDRAWQAALLYANEHSTTELAWANESTVMMRKPRKDNDISVMVSRVNSRDNSSINLVMEVRCNKTQAGDKFCNSEQSQEIEKGFIPYIEKAR